MVVNKQQLHYDLSRYPPPVGIFFDQDWIRNRCDLENKILEKKSTLYSPKIACCPHCWQPRHGVYPSNCDRLCGYCLNSHIGPCPGIYCSARWWKRVWGINPPDYVQINPTAEDVKLLVEAQVATVLDNGKLQWQITAPRNDDDAKDDSKPVPRLPSPPRASRPLTSAATNAFQRTGPRGPPSRSPSHSRQTQHRDHSPFVPIKVESTPSPPPQQHNRDRSSLRSSRPPPRSVILETTLDVEDTNPRRPPIGPASSHAQPRPPFVHRPARESHSSRAYRQSPYARTTPHPPRISSPPRASSSFVSDIEERVQIEVDKRLEAMKEEIEERIQKRVERKMEKRYQERMDERFDEGLETMKRFLKATAHVPIEEQEKREIKLWQSPMFKRKYNVPIESDFEMEDIRHPPREPHRHQPYVESVADSGFDDRRGYGGYYRPRNEADDRYGHGRYR